MAESYERYTGLLTDLDGVHNYYERLVLERLPAALGDKYGNDNYTADVACIALNHLPPRYVRFDLDMAFYMSPQEQKEMAEKVDKALNKAIDLVSNR